MLAGNPLMQLFAGDRDATRVEINVKRVFEAGNDRGRKPAGDKNGGFQSSARDIDSSRSDCTSPPTR